MLAKISSTVMILGMSSGLRALSADLSFRSSSPHSSSISRSTGKLTRSFMPQESRVSLSRETYFCMSTMPLEIIFTSLPSTATTAWVTPASSSSLASSLDTVTPASASTSPVEGSAMGWARVWPFRRPSRRSFLLYL